MFKDLQFKKVLLLLFLLVFPVYFLASSNLVFTEIMYDAKGTDTGFEWVEIKNNSNYSQSLKGYKFCEGGSSVVCHSLKEENNPNFNLEGGAYGIITDDRDKFKSKYNFSGLILVSTGFTLTNTGETIELKDKDGNILDSLTYNPNSGGQDGDTLSIFSDIWKNGQATPGAENIKKAKESNGGGDDEKDKTNHSYVEVSDILDGKKKLKAEIDEIKTIIAGAKTKISGRAYGLSGAEIYGVEFLWSLGDGTKDHGQNIFHEYYFSGEYLVSLVVKSGHFTSPKAIKKIIVIDPPLEISKIDWDKKFVEIKNNSDYDLNLQGWILQLNGEKFVIPENTYILKRGIIKFPAKNLNLRFKEGRFFILYPNGDKFQEYQKKDNSEVLNTKEQEDNKKENFSERETKAKNESSQKNSTEDKNNQSKKPKQKRQEKKEKTLEKRPKDKEISQNARFNLADNKEGDNLDKDFENVDTNQVANILPLKAEKNSFVKNNIVEISFFGFLLLLIFSLFFLRKDKIDMDLKKEAEEFEIIEEN